MVTMVPANSRASGSLGWWCSRWTFHPPSLGQHQVTGLAQTETMRKGVLLPVSRMPNKALSSEATTSPAVDPESAIPKQRAWSTGCRIRAPSQIARCQEPQTIQARANRERMWNSNVFSRGAPVKEGLDPVRSNLPGSHGPKRGWYPQDLARLPACWLRGYGRSPSTMQIRHAGLCTACPCELWLNKQRLP